MSIYTNLRDVLHHAEWAKDQALVDLKVANTAAIAANETAARAARGYGEACNEVERVRRLLEAEARRKGYVTGRSETPASIGLPATVEAAIRSIDRDKKEHTR
jgi:hypothetical protein